MFGHLTLAVIDRGPDGDLRGANLLAIRPGLAWLAMLAPMPVFFAAAGWANATATPRSAAPRLRALVGAGAVVVVLWSTAAATEVVIRGEGGVVGDGARIATQPLWFLVVYVPFGASGARIARLAKRPVLAVGTCLVVLAALDTARFRFDMADAWAWPGFFLAWGVPWSLGAWWRGRCDMGGIRESRVGIALATASLAAAFLLVRLAGYGPALIDAVDGARSNTTPPTLYTAVAGSAQVGLLMVASRRLDGLAARYRRILDSAVAAAVGVYVWHLTALAGCAGAIAAGLWAPQRFTRGWWLTRPLWFAAVVGVTGLLAALTARVQRPSGQRESLPPRPCGTAGTSLVAGLVLATTGAAVVGLRGPRTLPAAAVAVASFVAAWRLLGGATGAPVTDPGRDRPRAPVREPEDPTHPGVTSPQ